MDEREREITSAAERLDEAAFCGLYPHPFLVIRVAIDDEAAEFRTIGVGIDGLELTPLPPSADDAIECIVPVVKRPGASEFSFITIGRSSNNDVVIGLNSVSKCHAVIHPVEDGYELADAGSTNGTVYKGTAMEKGQRVVLSNGDEFLLSHRVSITFLDSAAAYAFVRTGRR